MRVRVILALAFLLAAAQVAAATPGQELEQARELFRAGKFASAIPSLNYLLYPTPRLSQPEDLVEAHVLLGVCQFESGDRKTAKAEFQAALYLNRDLELDTLLFSSTAVDFFDDVKKDMLERDKRDAEQHRLAEENERLQQALASMVVIETHPFYANIIPFGAGQFQNGEPSKGLFFAVSEGVTGGVSAGIWLYLVGQYGFAGHLPNDTDTINQVRHLEEVEIGSGIACIGLMAWGIVDSYLHYKPSVQRKPDKSLIPDITPAPTRGGASLSLSWEY